MLKCGRRTKPCCHMTQFCRDAAAGSISAEYGGTVNELHFTQQGRGEAVFAPFVKSPSPYYFSSLINCHTSVMKG